MNVIHQRIKNSRLIYNIVFFIFISIFYQQVLVINIGGSFKIYEFFGLLLVVIFFLFSEKFIYSKQSLFLFITFVIAPIPGNFFNVLNPIKLNYYHNFPEAVSKLRFNIWVAPILIYLYYLLNWTVINFIIGSKLVYDNHRKIIKAFVVSGSLITLYSLYGFFLVPKGLPDLVPQFLDHRNSTPNSINRPAGFSAEPGSYVLVVMWLFLYLLYIPNIFKNKLLQQTLLILTLIVLLLTQSTALLALVGSFIIFYLFINGWKSRFYLVIGLIAFVSVANYLISYWGIADLVSYIFYEKALNFFSKSDYTNINDSGEIRSYTNYLGIQIFKANPLFGVGGGNSYFYLWGYEKGGPTGIITYDMLPQSSYSKVLAELGLLGIIPFLLFFIFTVKDLLKKIISVSKNKSNNKNLAIYKVGFIGTVATFGMLLSIAPEYSLYIWINIALILNVLKYAKIKNEI